MNILEAFLLNLLIVTCSFQYSSSTRETKSSSETSSQTAESKKINWAAHHLRHGRGKRADLLPEFQIPDEMFDRETRMTGNNKIRYGKRSNPNFIRFGRGAFSEAKEEDSIPKGYKSHRQRLARGGTNFIRFGRSLPNYPDEIETSEDSRESDAEILDYQFPDVLIGRFLGTVVCGGNEYGCDDNDSN